MNFSPGLTNRITDLSTEQVEKAEVRPMFYLTRALLPARIHVFRVFIRWLAKILKHLWKFLWITGLYHYSVNEILKYFTVTHNIIETFYVPLLSRACTCTKTTGKTHDVQL